MEKSEPERDGPMLEEVGGDPSYREKYARTRDIKQESGVKTAGQDFSLFREYNLQRLQSKQEESTEEEEMKQQQRMAIVKDLMKKFDQKEGWMLKTSGGSRSCWRRTVRAWIHPGWEDTMHKWYEWLV